MTDFEKHPHPNPLPSRARGRKEIKGEWKIKESRMGRVRKNLSRGVKDVEVSCQ